MAQITNNKELIGIFMLI